VLVPPAGPAVAARPGAGLALAVARATDIRVGVMRGTTAHVTDGT
jgi:hypothetical protein